jgi:hypothetical protein
LGATTHLRDGDDGVVELGYGMSREGDGGGGCEWECGAAEFVGVRILLEKVYITPYLSVVDYLNPQPIKSGIPHPNLFKTRQ